MTLTENDPAGTDPVVVPTGVTNTYPVRLAAAVLALFPATVAVLASFHIWSPTEAQLGTLPALFTALIFVVSEIAAGRVASAATVAKIHNAVAQAARDATPAPANPMFAPFVADTTVADLPLIPPPRHPRFGPVGGRSGPGTEGNS